MNREGTTMTKSRCSFADLTESIGSPAVNRDAGVVTGVKILGRVSRNGREYSQAALEQSVPLYEGLGVNVNHPDRATPGIGRSVQDGIGCLKNVVLKEDGVYGDLHYLKSHPVAEMLCEAAERMPSRFGLSHNATGDSVERGGKRIVESIDRIRSVDLVQNPATVNSLFESEAMPVTTKTIKQIFEAIADKTHKASALALLEMDGMDTMGATPVDMSGMVPAEGIASATSSDDQIRAAFKAAINAVTDDTTLSVADMLMKIETLLNSQAAALGIDIEAAEEATEIPVEGDATVTESLQEMRQELDAIKAERDGMKADANARALLESKGVQITDHRIKTLRAVSDKATQTALLEDWSRLTVAVKPNAKRPATSPPADSQLMEGTEFPKDHKTFLRQVGAKARS